MDENTNIKPDFMTVAEVASLCRVQKKTVYNWNYLGDGPPCYRPRRGRILYDRREVEAWLRMSRRSGGGNPW
jgi:hypothetical protein